jgi:hypothetical protein
VSSDLVAVAIRRQKRSRLLESRAPNSRANAARRPHVRVDPGGHNIQGNCSGPPPPEIYAKVKNVPLLPLRPRQCVILVSATFWSSYDTREAWIDNIYLRFHEREEPLGGIGFGIGMGFVTAPRLYMTNVTLQGDRQTHLQAYNPGRGWDNTDTWLFMQRALPCALACLAGRCT